MKKLLSAALLLVGLDLVAAPIFTNQFTTNLVTTNVYIPGYFQGNYLTLTNGGSMGPGTANSGNVTNVGLMYFRNGGRIRAQEGTANAPSYGFFVNGDSGMFLVDASGTNVAIGNSENIFQFDGDDFVADSGNLGRSDKTWIDGYIYTLYSYDVRATNRFLLNGTNVYSILPGNNVTFATNGTIVTITASNPVYLGIAASDETTALTSGTNKVQFRAPFAFTLTSVRASLSTAQPSGGLLTVDINENGSSVLSTKLTFDNGEKTTTTALAPGVLSDTSIADDAQIEVDIDAIGTSGATGLKVWLIGTKP